MKDGSETDMTGTVKWGCTLPQAEEKKNTETRSNRTPITDE